MANCMATLRKELLLLSHACGHAHPGLVTSDCLELIDDRFNARAVSAVFEYDAGWGLSSEGDRRASWQSWPGAPMRSSNERAQPFPQAAL